MMKKQQKQEKEQLQQEQRVKYMEKTKNILVFEPGQEEKPKKSGKVKTPLCKIVLVIDLGLGRNRLFGSG